MKRALLVGRRRVLGLLAASPIAAKQMAEHSVMELAGMRVPAGMGSGNPASGIGGPGPVQSIATSHRLAAMRISWVREAIRAELYADERNVSFIDYDLATKRSFSLAAKVAFQRQRNVERRLASLEREHEYVWDRLSAIISKWGGVLRGTDQSPGQGPAPPR